MSCSSLSGSPAVLCALLLCFLGGCSAKLVNVRADLQNPAGIPWVEPREYEVYVYHVKEKDVFANLVSYGRNSLGDVVNGVVIDPDRPKWTINYVAQTFSDASLKVTLHENGSLKEAALTTQPGAADALKTLDEGLSAQDKIDAKELERLEREKKLRDAREALK